MSKQFPGPYPSRKKRRRKAVEKRAERRRERRVNAPGPECDHDFVGPDGEEVCAKCYAGPKPSGPKGSDGD